MNKNHPMKFGIAKTDKGGDIHIPMHAAVAHDDVAGPQPAAQLGGHWQQPNPGGAARRVHTGSCALGSDKRGYKAIKLIQSIERPHELREQSDEQNIQLIL